MKKTALKLTIIASLLAANAVFAGTMGPVAANDWTGFYVGANLGGYWENRSIDIKSVNIFQNPLNSNLQRLFGPDAALATTGKIPLDSSGFTGGIQAGYNYQINPVLVAGIETDFQALGGGNSGHLRREVPAGFLPSVTAKLSVNQRTEYLGTLRGRLGVLVPRFDSLLAYFTGGLAYGSIHSSTGVSGVLNPPSPFLSDFGGFRNISTIQTGYTVGGGVEKILSPQWSVKAEYLYYDLGTLSYRGNQSARSVFAVAPGVNVPQVLFTNRTTSHLGFNGNMIRVGINYHFA